MAKEDVPIIKAKPPKLVAGKDQYERISYLYQASTIFANNPKYETLSRALSRNVDLVAKKNVLKLSPLLKRSICKKCNRRLIPGRTGSYNVENNSKKKTPKNDILVIQCVCGAKKRFPFGKNPDYVLFSEKEDVVTKV